MRDCLFLVADKTMGGMVRGFLSRENFHLSLNCGPFEFDPKQDLLVANGLNDPGLYNRANELLKGYRKSYRHAVVILDADWDGSPGTLDILTRLRSHLEDAGWNRNEACAVVIDPELENWVWQDSRHVCAAVGYESFDRLRVDLEGQGFWLPGQNKPLRPKEAFEWTLRKTGKPLSSSIYQQMAAKVSIKGCKDEAFIDLITALRSWFQ